MGCVKRYLLRVTSDRGTVSRVVDGVVRAEGLEPSLSLRKNGFSYPPTTFAALAWSKVWGLDYPFTLPAFRSQVLPV